MATENQSYRITRHACPRNCYDTCSILAYTQNGILHKVEGDPSHSYTNGKLCTKGYSYTNRVYHPERLRTPMLQTHRGSGRWQEISWEEAMKIIADKILSLNHRYGNNLALALNKYSGNFGILHNAAEGMFNSLGPTTQAIGSPCWSAGLDAHTYDFGDYLTSDPEEMVHSQLIILWGVNPAWTAVHSMPFIYKAKEQGATVVVIDPIYTTTARKSDIYIQVNPGSDIYLALAIAKVIIEQNWQDTKFIKQYTHGWEHYNESLKNYDFNDLLSLCGQTIEVITELAELMYRKRPMMIWTGFGLQRHLQGGQTIRAINALAAITGNIGTIGSGVQFAQQQTWQFNYNILMRSAPHSFRAVDINTFDTALQELDNPPIKLLWISCRNLLTQSPARKSLMKSLKNLELIVTVDQFLTPTAQLSDIVLPTTTQFEEWDIVASYWHHWIAINEPAIKPYYDSKSELEIAQLLSKTLNVLQPGFCRFPTDLSSEDFIDNEFNNELYQQLDINNWRELLDGPKKIKLPTAWENLSFKTPTKKFEFLMATLDKKSNSPKYPYWLLSPHAQFAINSQFQNNPWIQKLKPEPEVVINPITATDLAIITGSMVKVFNQNGSIVAKARVSNDVPGNSIVFYQGWTPKSNVFVNDLVENQPTDMGNFVTGSPGVAFYNTFVNIQKL
ncbi:molybdopterin-dependent oxidoreductase [Desulfuribacillus alkaliarsenatis]|uniref:Molybdopterin oxidoreductase n=1 Tax=Desulfuribacillus alkaliarsenatis TaxID=766136 RepID=A0A1E5G024_9FIRM|nr:molybdopterin-dependent oxidoreductase [Desulfuribacillus alkaliarsenatis]OEF95827.1 molybdopterin oxidoreductase [Desulfuribacillus alkaliarsenatis]